MHKLNLCVNFCLYCTNMYRDYWETWGYLNTQLYEKLVSFDYFMLAGLFLNDCLKQKLCMTIHVIKLKKNICIFSLHSFSTPCYICPLMIRRGRSIWKAFGVVINFPYSVNQGASVHDESLFKFGYCWNFCVGELTIAALLVFWYYLPLDKSLAFQTWSSQTLE